MLHFGGGRKYAKDQNSASGMRSLLRRDDGHQTSDLRLQTSDT
jgi:hypothetical protein